MSAVLLDIEGTIGDIAFVREVLFPFARARVGDVLKARWTDSEIATCVAGAREASGQPLPEARAAAAQFLAWMDEDKKITPLKALQGIVWREGYASGELKAHLYPDAVEAMRTWAARAVAVYIYSSGSIEAQKLYAKYSMAGDLTSLIRGYFDTTTGPKGDASSYTKIAAAIGLPAREITFFSDMAAETDAALAAGLNVFCVDRKKPTTHEGRDGATAVIGSFATVMGKIL